MIFWRFGSGTWEKYSPSKKLHASLKEVIFSGEVIAMKCTLGFGSWRLVGPVKFTCDLHLGSKRAV